MEVPAFSAYSYQRWDIKSFVRWAVYPDLKLQEHLLGLALKFDYAASALSTIVVINPP